MTSSDRPDDRTDRRRVAHIVVRADLGPQLQEVLPECEITTVLGEIHISGRLQDQTQLYAILDPPKYRCDSGQPRGRPVAPRHRPTLAGGLAGRLSSKPNSDIDACITRSRDAYR